MKIKRLDKILKKSLKQTILRNNGKKIINKTSTIKQSAAQNNIAKIDMPVFRDNLNTDVTSQMSWKF